jgi:hypothetical protein
MSKASEELQNKLILIHEGLLAVDKGLKAQRWDPFIRNWLEIAGLALERAMQMEREMDKYRQES